MIRPHVFGRYAALQVPRYTSYPTAPNFVSTSGDSVHRDWLRDVPASEPLSVYLHMPFCRQMCWYCGCHTTVAKRDAPIARYVEHLAAEIRLVRSQFPERATVAHLHWGGGTPTVLAPEAIRTLDQQLREAFEFTPDAEIGLEIDPRTLTDTVAGAFADSGVNRVSLGVQTFDPVVLEAINRVQPIAQVTAAVALCRQFGFGGVNFDLI